MNRRLASALVFGAFAVCVRAATGCNDPSAHDPSRNEGPIGHVAQATGTTFWTQVTATVPEYDQSPPVYDPIRKVILLATAKSGAWQTWSWDGTAWTIKCSGAACGLPTPGADAYTLKTSFDRVRNVVVAVGEDIVGATDPSSFATYEWTGSTWQIKCSAGDAGTPCGPNAPAALGGIVFDENVGRTIAIGGATSTSGSGILSGWDGTSWRHEFTDDTHATLNGLAGFDPIAKRLILYGTDDQVNTLDTTTSWWTSGAGWTDFCGGAKGACAIKGRRAFFGESAIDRETGHMVVYGGACGPPSCFLLQNLQDSWMFDGANWTPLCGAGLPDGGNQEDCGPGQLSYFGLTFDEVRREFVVIGEEGAAPTTMWIYRVGGATCAADTDCGGDQICSTIDKVCCDQNCTDVCHSCTTTSAPGICTELTHGESDDTCNNGKACGANGVCEIAAGAACNSDTACASGHCSDGVCCTTACDGQCDVCTRALGASADGTCSNAPAGYAGGPSCGGFACSGTSPSCPASCSTDKDCTSGFSCVSGKCEGVTCDGDHTVTTSDGTKIDCAPYKCGGDQACKKTCSNVNDCSAPNVCNSSGACVAPSPASDGGCSVSNRETSRSIPTLLLGILAVVARRRRSRRRA